ncbi:coatomer WD associated region-domain-containing protein [Mycena olivaceomarginata]|nr:coatomer WD associated region-domain-containing protein [Mycena olivaceomarginata]
MHSGGRYQPPALHSIWVSVVPNDHTLSIRCTTPSANHPHQLTFDSDTHSYGSPRDHFAHSHEDPRSLFYSRARLGGKLLAWLGHSRPAFVVHQDSLYYIWDKYMHSYDFNTGVTSGFFLCMSSAAHASRPGRWASTRQRGPFSTRALTARRGPGTNSVVKTIKPPVQTNEIFYRGTQQKTQNSPSVKYVVWGNEGDHGVICTIDNPMYLTRVKDKTVHCLDCSACPRTITFDPTEYRFKLVLLKNNYEEMLYIICMSTLLRQSTIVYLQQKGFPEDTNTRFELALECGNLDVVMETAKTINRPECWDRLAQQALKQDRGEGLPADKEF